MELIFGMVIGGFAWGMGVGVGLGIAKWYLRARLTAFAVKKMKEHLR